MQIRVAVRPCAEHVVGIFDDERVVRSGNELDEDFVVVERAPIRGVKDFRAVALALRQSGENGSHEARLSGSGRALQDQHRFGRLYVSRDQLSDAFFEHRIRFVEEWRIRELVE